MKVATKTRRYATWKHSPPRRRVKARAARPVPVAAVWSFAVAAVGVAVLLALAV